MIYHLNKKMRCARGQVALETLVVLGLYLFVIIFFINIILSLNGRIIAQGALNKAVKEVAALGCEPSLTSEGLPGGSSGIVNYDSFLQEDIEVFGNRIKREAPAGDLDISWTYYDSDDQTFQDLEKCEDVFSFDLVRPPDPAPFGRIITGKVTYRQTMPLLALLTGSDPEVTVKSSMISSSLEKR